MNLENNTVVTSEVKKVEREPEPATRHRTQSIDVQGPEISRVRSASHFAEEHVAVKSYC